MNWGSLSEFLAMGGYALYVWSSFGVCLLAMIIEVVLVRHRFVKALAERSQATGDQANFPSSPASGSPLS